MVWRSAREGGSYPQRDGVIGRLIGGYKNRRVNLIEGAVRLGGGACLLLTAATASGRGSTARPSSAQPCRNAPIVSSW
eukprot:scaffold17185_cov101-Isochrysis_galbana.AAC.1